MGKQAKQASKGEFLFQDLPWDRLEVEADSLLRELFPVCRSLTGDGVRQTLRRLQQIAAFEMFEIPSGTQCYDWTVPDEWNVRDAYIANLQGERLVDFRHSNLHLASYSIPFEGTLEFDELDRHLHSLPALPDAIPYRTTYYKRDWGFCLTERQRQALNRDAAYRVVIDATLSPGHLTYGECLLPGASGEEFLISSYCCHPSLANDNLSGIILWALLLRELQSRPRRHAYRFVLVPETIGAIAYLCLHEEAMKGVAGGFIPTTVAGPGPFGFKRTYLGDNRIDRVIENTLREQRLAYEAYPFDINGSDETQYSAPHFRIPIGTICKDKYYEYPQYHTSLDNLDFVSAAALVDSLKLYLLAIEKLELDLAYRSLHPYSEPMLGKRGLYPSTGGSIKQSAVDPGKSHLERVYRIGEQNVAYGSELDAIRWVMFMADGSTGLLQVAETSGLPQRQLYDTAQELCRQGLLERSRRAKEATVRLVWIGGTHPRHLHYIQAVQAAFPLSGAIVERREKLIPTPPAGTSDGDRRNFELHFARRAEAEDRYFGSPQLPDCQRLEVDPVSLNEAESVDFIRAVRPDLVLVFGSGLIKPPLADHLPKDTINLHLGISPRYRGAATLFWPFYFLEPPYAGSTFHYIVSEPDAGDVIHQVVPELHTQDGIHDVACKTVVAWPSAAVRLLEIFDRDGGWKTHRQRATGKNFLASDFKPEHLRVIYDLYQDRMVKAYLDGRLASKRPKLFQQY